MNNTKCTTTIAIEQELCSLSGHMNSVLEMVKKIRDLYALDFRVVFVRFDSVLNFLPVTFLPVIFVGFVLQWNMFSF